MCDGVRGAGRRVTDVGEGGQRCGEEAHDVGEGEEVHTLQTTLHLRSYCNIAEWTHHNDT